MNGTIALSRNDSGFAFQYNVWENHFTIGIRRVRFGKCIFIVVEIVQCYGGLGDRITSGGVGHGDRIRLKPYGLRSRSNSASKGECLWLGLLRACSLWLDLLRAYHSPCIIPRPAT